MSRKGRIKYVPKSVIEELDYIRKGESLPDSEAFRDMVRYSQIGREVERFRSTIFPGIEKKKVKR